MLNQSGASTRLHLRLPRLELRPQRQPQRRRLSQEGVSRQGRHAPRLAAPRLTARASCASTLSPDSSSARSPTTCRRSSEYLGDEIVARDQPRDARAREVTRPLHPDPAEQLEALLRERQGHLPREPAAHVLHDLPHQSVVAAGRHRGEQRRQSRELLACRRYGRPGIRAGPACARRRKASGSRRRSLLETVDEFGDGIGLQILSVFPNFVLQQIHNASRCAGAAAGPRQDRAAVDLFRLRGRRRRDDRAPLAAEPI